MAIAIAADMSQAIVRTKVLPFIATILVVSLVSGCANTVRYRVPLERNPRLAEGAACFERCQIQHADNSDLRALCVSECPGSTRDEGSCHASDRLCADRSEIRGGTVAALVGSAVLIG